MCQEKSSELRVSRPIDPVEIEADQIAERVMRMPANVPVTVKNHSHPSDELQAKCSACEEEEEKEETSIQRKEGSIAADPIPPGDEAPPDDGATSLKKVISAGGYPLERETRNFFEPRFGMDLGNVRIHTGSTAEQSARAINARACTIGNNIVFGGGEYRLAYENGRHLLAYELAHVVQSAGPYSKIDRSVIYRQPGEDEEGAGESEAPMTRA